jgi:hypothetical protein
MIFLYYTLIDKNFPEFIKATRKQSYLCTIFDI